MKVAYDSTFYAKLKKINVRVRKKVKVQIAIFSQNPNDPQLNNHLLKREYEGYNSIDITADYRAIYKMAKVGDQVFAYFILLGTHKELFG